MRKLSLLLIGVFLIGSASTRLTAAQQQNSEVQIIRARQKQERQALKLKERYSKASFKGQHVPKGIRDQRKHEMQQQRRELRDKQKAELQQARDQIRVYKQSLSAQ